MTSASEPSRTEATGGFSCPHYEPPPGKKRCRHYQDGGACARPAAQMCVEWLRRNGNRQLQSAAKKQPTDLLGEPLAEPKKPRTRRPAVSQALRQQPVTIEGFEDVEEPEPLAGLRVEDIESFKKMGFTVRLRCEACDELYLVPEYTGKDRMEISPEHGATLVRIAEAFPGTEILSFDTSRQEQTEQSKGA